MTKQPKRLIFLPDYIKAAKTLAKRYRNLERDVDPTLDALKRGEILGDRIPNFPSHAVYKVRVANSDAKRGKSGGYRIIFCVYLDDAVVLITIYSKSDMDNVSNEFIAELLRRLESEE
ncbi:MAG: type II toxin-antitoxin system RelE/ParE family toxin [Anaerolineae bacterium]|jgi:mRNA-degrading endonuclease RelE of RelBE toxin-antitoxin system|nr:type II toxin-antitoxin system RelE/ParE family toxin [Anaerolineae bacterium]